MISRFRTVVVEITLNHVAGIPDIVVPIAFPYRICTEVSGPYPGHSPPQRIRIACISTIHQLTPEGRLAVRRIAHPEISRRKGPVPPVVGSAYYRGRFKLNDPYAFLILL